MARRISASEFQRKVREAQRKVEQAQKKAIDDYNRKAKARNQKVQAEARRTNQENQKKIDQYNRHVDSVNQHNKTLVENLNVELSRRPRSSSVVYTVRDQELVDRVQGGIVGSDREYDFFLSYARIDGGEAADTLRNLLTGLGVSVWQDEIGLHLGKSVSRQIDNGLLRARAGIALLTPAYIAGRFWTERELGALLHKETLIPVLHNVSFDDVKKYSAFLPDLLGLTTAENSMTEIANKIAGVLSIQG
ncbi:TIR domain-containing protein [Actinokineospora sp. G85]|uniref:toll/interleukin-1 receptor domain-containing protein n=1 Tax=Actinokineospora sp. G85 TaxID=3406626 RepID=UPI003C75FA22